MNEPRRPLGLAKQILLTLFFAAVVFFVKRNAWIWPWNDQPVMAAQFLLFGSIGYWLISFVIGMLFHIVRQFVRKNSAGMTYFWVATVVLVLMAIPWPEKS